MISVGALNLLYHKQWYFLYSELDQVNRLVTKITKSHSECFSIYLAAPVTLFALWKSRPIYLALVLSVCLCAGLHLKQPTVPVWPKILPSELLCLTKPHGSLVSIDIVVVLMFSRSWCSVLLCAWFIYLLFKSSVQVTASWLVICLGEKLIPHF